MVCLSVNDVKTSLKTLFAVFKFNINKLYIGVERPEEITGYPDAEFFNPTKENVEIYLEKVVTECPADEFVWLHVMKFSFSFKFVLH